MTCPSRLITAFTGHPTESGLYLFDGIMAPMEGSSDFAWEVRNGLLWWYTKPGEGTFFKLPHGFLVFGEAWGNHGPNTRTQYVFPVEIAGEFTKLGGPQALSEALWFQGRDGDITPEDRDGNSTLESEDEDEA